MKWWSRFVSLDFQKKEDKLKIIIILSFLGLFLGGVASASLVVTGKPEFCASCHEMRPEYFTWKNTSHNRISCDECHIPPGLLSMVTHRVGLIKELYLHAMEAYNNPIRISEENRIPNASCQKCHSSRRVYTTLGDIIVPHDKHLEKGVLCVSCHGGVAHGNIAVRRVTQVIPYTNWDDYQGKEETSRYFTSPRMDQCIKCHTDRKVSNRCETCHTTYFTPKDHDSEGWNNNHGQTARVDAYSCRKCHVYGSDTAPVMTGEAVAKVARGTSFCYDCHNKRPENHGWYKTIWMAEHKKTATIRGKAYCTVCHSISEPQPQEQATKTFCNKCHFFE